MEREMLNINGNLVGEITTTAIDTKEGGMRMRCKSYLLRRKD